MKKTCSEKSVIKTLSLLLCLITIFSCGESIDQEEWISTKENTYSIDYPKDWELDDSGQTGTKFMLFSQLTTENDQFRENVNLVIEDLSDHDITLDNYVEISENQILTLITKAKMVSSNRIESEIEHHEVVFTGKQGFFDLKFIQHYYVVNKMAYVLTFTAEMNEFEKFEKIAKRILNSFKITTYNKQD